MAQRTFPDWGSSPGQLPAPDIDLAELASRTGSISAVSRDGRVIFQDGFEGGLDGWTILAGQALASLEAPYLGNVSLKLVPTAAGTFDVQISKYFPVFSTRKIGVEFFFASDLNSKIVGMFLRYGRLPGDFFWNVRVEYITELLQYESPIGVWNTIANVQALPGASGRTWHNVKIIIDLENLLLDRVRYDAETFQVGAAQMVSGISTGKYFEFQFWATDVTGFQRYSFVDNFIFTIDEY